MDSVARMFSTVPRLSKDWSAKMFSACLLRQWIPLIALLIFRGELLARLTIAGYFFEQIWVFLWGFMVMTFNTDIQ